MEESSKTKSQIYDEICKMCEKYDWFAICVIVKDWHKMDDDVLLPDTGFEG